MLDYTESNGWLTFAVRAVPRASKCIVAGEHGGALRVRVAAPPVEGAANEALVKFLARELGVPARDVEIAGGHHSKLKRLRVRGTNAARLLNLVVAEK